LSNSAVVPVDDAAVEVVEVGRGEPATVELHHRAQLRRDHRDDVEDHGAGVVDPLAVVVAAVEGRDDLEALDRLLLALGGQRALPLLRVDRGLELLLLDVEVEAADERLQRVGAHAALEVLAVAVLQLTPEHLVFEDLAREQVEELVPDATEHVDLGLVGLAERGHLLLSGLLARLEVGVLGPLGLERGDLGLELGEAVVDALVALLLDRLALGEHLLLEVGAIGVATLVVDPGDEVGREVDDLLELLGLQLLTSLGAHEQVGEPRPGAAEVPDVHDRGRQLDVAHALAPDLGAGDLHAAALADDALEADALVLAAVALPVLGGTEDLLAEEPVLLRLERAVVDGLRLLHLAVGPRADGVGRGQTDPELAEVVDVEHVAAFLLPRTRTAHGAARLLRRCRALGGTGRSPAPRRCGRCLRRARASRSPHPSGRGPRR
jgi:hypothetical protein